MIDYKNCLLPEFVWTNQDLDFFLEQKGEAGKFWHLVYEFYCDDQQLLYHMNEIQHLLVLAKLHKYPAGTLKLDFNKYPDSAFPFLEPKWESSEMLFARIACKAIGIENAFIDKLRRTAHKYADGKWNKLTYAIDLIEHEIDFTIPFDIDLNPRPNEYEIMRKIRIHEYKWDEITSGDNRDTIDFILSLMPSKELKLEVLEDINLYNSTF